MNNNTEFLSNASSMSIATASNIPPASMIPVSGKQPFIQSSSSNMKEISKTSYNTPLQINQINSNTTQQVNQPKTNLIRSSTNANRQPDASINNIVGVVIMVKNEETSIQATIDSVKDYIKHIIVFDTGSTDKTIEIIKNTCTKNKQTLHLKQGVFESFPKSRNVSLDFAECVPVRFLMLMDAGDEFKTSMHPIEFLQAIESCPKEIGLVRLKWLDQHGLEDHGDLRFVLNNSSIRYDEDHPVHEVLNKYVDYADLTNLFCLYQDRMKYGAASKFRYARDVELLTNAKPTKRNLHYLGQTYFCMQDYENSYKYYVQSIKIESELPTVHDAIAYLRAGICAFNCKLSEKTILGHLENSIKESKKTDTLIDPYIYILKYHLDTRKPENALAYLDELSALEIKPFTQNIIRNEFYDYDRWNLISIVCLMTNKKIDLGYKAIQRILHYGKPDDENNYKIYEQIRSGQAKYDPTIR
jgi:glycosyltransferase involved in cell wall biosynthesis